MGSGRSTQHHEGRSNDDDGDDDGDNDDDDDVGDDDDDDDDDNDGDGDDDDDDDDDNDGDDGDDDDEQLTPSSIIYLHKRFRQSLELVSLCLLLLILLAGEEWKRGFHSHLKFYCLSPHPDTKSHHSCRFFFVGP
jgi:hypothetical protein